MNNLYAAGLHEHLRVPHGALHSFCKQHAEPYTVVLDKPEEQHYQVPLAFASKLQQHLSDVCDERYVQCNLDKDEQQEIGIIKLTLVSEDQYKSPTDVHVRRQSGYPSTFGPSKSHGGVDRTHYESLDRSFESALEEALKNNE